MGALPKKKLSKARKGKRLASKKYNLPKLVDCKQCHKPYISHHICPNCGYYNKNKFLEIKEKAKVTKVSSSEKE